MTLGAIPIAKRGNWSTPSRIKNSVTPASITAIGTAITAAVAKAPEFGTLALRAMITPVKPMPSDANGQPPRDNKAAVVSATRNARSPFRAATRLER